MTDRGKFMVEVKSAAEGTPYVVEPTNISFDVRIDVVDAKWSALAALAILAILGKF